jgi:hypothetical protein
LAAADDRQGSRGSGGGGGQGTSAAERLDCADEGLEEARAEVGDSGGAAAVQGLGGESTQCAGELYLLLLPQF